MGWVIAAAVYGGVLWWVLREQAKRNRHARWCLHCGEKFFNPFLFSSHVASHASDSGRTPCLQ